MTLFCSCGCQSLPSLQAKSPDSGCPCEQDCHPSKLTNHLIMCRSGVCLMTYEALLGDWHSTKPHDKLSEYDETHATAGFSLTAGLLGLQDPTGLLTAHSSPSLPHRMLLLPA